MKIYLAGTVGTREREKLYCNHIKSRLISYYYYEENLMGTKSSFDIIVNHNLKNTRSKLLNVPET